MSDRGVVWLEEPFVLIAHERYLAEHGKGSGGVDPMRLAAALMLPRTVASFSEPSRLSEVAARYASAVLRLRPFWEGNEAMAFLLSLLFLEVNGVDVPSPPLEKYEMFTALADGRVQADAYAQWMRLRHLAARQGADAVFEVGMRDGVVVRAAGLRATPPSGRLKAVPRPGAPQVGSGGDRRRRPQAPPALSPPDDESNRTTSTVQDHGTP